MVFDTPILFIVFNRPSQTEKVFEVIKRLRPAKLFICADGPREGIGGDEAACAKVRDIVKKVEWSCDLHTLFNDYNKGCGSNASAAINWFFSNVDQGIILEDDTLPDATFFSYCEELLARYKHDERIGMIGGFNYLQDEGQYPYSYYFSHYYPIWGWATWKRAWSKYEFGFHTYDLLDYNGMLHHILDRNQMRLTKMVKNIKDGKHDTWDIQWVFNCLANNYLSVIPRFNLIKNIGFDKEGTHTITARTMTFKNESLAIEFPMKHPVYIARDIYMDGLHKRKFFKAKYKNIDALLYWFYHYAQKQF